MGKIKKPAHRCEPCDAAVFDFKTCSDCWWYWVEEVEILMGSALQRDDSAESFCFYCQAYHSKNHTCFEERR